MDDDQQFCLRWNNHQSTLISQFDTLLENETLVDCTLAAEGKYLRAHKVVLSACSPYFESLLRLQYDKHPIFILKDVKYQELRAMMDYMYRGEVNISQDQLGALLKAAESLQIKGLSDSKGGDKRPPPRQSSPVPAPSSSKTLTVSKQTRSAPIIPIDSDIGPPSPVNARETSVTPPPRKRKKLRRRSHDDEASDNHDNQSNHSSSHSHSQHPINSPNIPLPIPIIPITKASSDDDQMPDELEQLPSASTSSLEQNILDKPNTNIASLKIKESPMETHTEIMIEPKAEYVDDVNEDSVEDLTLDDEDMDDMDQNQAGPSHGGEGSSQGFGAWHMGGDRTQDEVFMAAQEATSGHRDTQDFAEEFCGEVEYLIEEDLVEDDENLMEGDVFDSKINQQTEYIISDSYMDETGTYFFTPSDFPITDYDQKPIIMTKNNKPRKFPLHMTPRYKKSEYSNSKCPRCGKVYSLFKNMKRHLRLECGREPQFQCPFCPTKCKRNNQLKNHIMLKHSVELIADQEISDLLDSENDQ